MYKCVANAERGPCTRCLGATLIRKLDVYDAIFIQDIASRSAHFKLMKELLIPCCALSHQHIPAILQNCESLATVVLRGTGTLLPSDIRDLETLKCFAVLSTSREIRIEDDALQQICASCPMLERPDFSSEFIHHPSTWECLNLLKHLACLSFTRISTIELLHMSKACPTLQSLKISNVQNDYDVTVAQALDAFDKLWILSVDGDYGTRWFDPMFRTPRELGCYDVQQLQMDGQQISHLVQRCGEKLPHVNMSARTLTQNALKVLHDSKKLESIAVYGVCSDNMLLQMLYMFPNLVRVEINFAGEAIDAVSQLITLVDIRDKSGRDYTRFALSTYFTSHAAGDMTRAAGHFKELLVLNTWFSENQGRDSADQCWWMVGGKSYWVPLGLRRQRTVRTSLPVISKTLKYHVVNVYKK